MNQFVNKTTNPIFKKELFRKLFHVALGSLLILTYLFLGRTIAVFIYTALLILALLSDIIRIRIYVKYPLKKIAETISRSYERTNVGAHTYFLAGLLVSLIFFDEVSFLIGAFAVTFVDPIISLTGLILDKPKHPYNKEKSMIGTIVGCVIAFSLALFYLDYYRAFAIALLVYFLDSLPLHLSDNFIYPLALGLANQLL